MNKSLNPEILAPAGSMESLTAAGRCGADAVYIGAKRYSARASAQNFDKQELEKAVYYCHARGVKVYLALNTLLTDDEMDDAAETVKEACSLPVDAVIVQDIGLASFIRSACPSLRLHGSTQMSIHTPQGAKELYRQGFSRVVLARELSKEEIAEIAESCPIELEVFVHGALCMSVSGQCYFSSLLGGRSGNRGQCAQPCRLPFSVQGGTGHDLSLKDLSLLHHLGGLRGLGVHSFKIEGRMKRPEYVAASVAAAKKAVSLGFLPYEDSKLLEQVFSRSGFTDGYYGEQLGRKMFGTRTKEDVAGAQPALLSQIRAQYKDEKQRIPVSFALQIKEGRPARLTARDLESHEACAEGALPQAALNAPLDASKCVVQLEKTGGTPFVCRDVRCDIDEGLSLPLSQINGMRREALKKLEQSRALRSALHFEDTKAAVPEHRTGQRGLAVRARFADSDIPACFKRCELVYVPLYTAADRLSSLLEEGFPLAVEIPRGMFGREQQIISHLKAAKERGVTHALAQNIGAIPLAKELGFAVHGGFGLNIMNSLSAEQMRLCGLSDVETSFELTEKKTNALAGEIPRGFLAYGRLPLMLTRNCPVKNGKADCSSCKHSQHLTDRKREKFPMQCDYNCTEVLNCVPLCVFDKITGFSRADFCVLRFSVENRVEKEEIFRKFEEKKCVTEPFTRGLYYRGVL